MGEKINSFWKKRYLLIILLGCSLLYSSKKYNTRNNSENSWHYIVSMDGRGYYAYLPAIFIYNDPTYSFYPEKNPLKENHINFTHEIEGEKRINKFFCGEAVLLFPFFTAAHLFTKFSKYDSDGYSKPYYVSVGVAAVFYVSLGLWFLHLLILSLTKNRLVSIITPLIILFGSNLYYYAIYEPSMSHVYSFFLVSIFLFYFNKVKYTLKINSLIIVGLILGLITIVRPVNLVIIAIVPFFYNNRKELFEYALNKKTLVRLAVSLISFVFVILIQLYIYKWQTEEWFYWSYKEEGFNFSNPQIFNTLFSYQRGFFIYCPICFFALFGFVILFKKSIHRSFWLLATIFLSIYVVSCWHEWRYGWAYGLRAYIEFLPLYAILIAFILNIQNKYALILLCFISILCVLYTQIQTAQIVKGIIPLAGASEELFWEVFLKMK
ncbi:MAG: hypothetical protein ACK4K0_07010 [Flavobacteriales bacterium]